jgi:acetylornithine deacetylase/succinyl-diaminopimelate desuccinylase-like protein
MRLAWNVGISLLLFFGCAAPSKEPISVFDRLKERSGTLLSRAIQFQTVNPPGDERPLAEYYAALLKKAGIEAAVVATPKGASKPGRAAAWGVVHGSGERRPLVLLSHLDVVPADATAWERDPFAGIRDGDNVLGRGALDAKGVSIVHLLVLITLAERETPLKRDIIFLATPDEESGGRDGAGFIVRNHRDLLADAEYLLTEGGGILNRGDREPALWRVGVVEKSPCWLRITAHGTPGHSSVPPRDAAVPRLVAALSRLSQIEPPVRVVPEVAQMYAALAPLASVENAAGYADLANHLDSDPRFRSRFLALRSQAALVSNTMTVTMLKGSARTNVLPAQAVAHIDARLLPRESCQRFSNHLRDVIADSKVSVEILLSFQTRSSSSKTPLFAAIETIANKSSPAAHTVPSVTIGFTDAHYFRDAGLISYGFTPRPLRREDIQGVHGHNERAKTGPLAEAVTTLVKILEELDRREALEESDGWD